MPASSKTKTQPALTAAKFLQALKGKPSGENTKDNPAGRTLGVPMASVFKLAKVHMAMPLREIEKLLESEFYEARMGAVSIMDFLARDKKTTSELRKQLFDLYIKRHDRINNWSLVDRSAPHVVGGYLNDKPRKILYKLARSKYPWEKRTAIVSTWFFIRQNQVDDTFKIAELMVHDPHEVVSKAVGSWIREAGKRDPDQLKRFLDKYAATMPRVSLRYAIEKLTAKEKEKYMKMGKVKSEKSNFLGNLFNLMYQIFLTVTTAISQLAGAGK